jgi:enamine deaminase RidA (YjgF/YER057c/UK114 family)
MSRIDLVNAEELREPAGFSQVAVGGGMVWVSGQLGTNGDGEIEHPGELAAQAGQAFRNVATALSSAGCDPSDVVRMTYYVTDVRAYRADGPQIGRQFESVFGDHLPAATVVGVNELINPDALLQIDCVALARGRARR